MAPAFSVDEFQITSEETGLCREVTLLTPSEGSPGQLFLILDAEFYREQLDAFGIIERLLAAEQIPTTAFALVSHIDNSHRHVDYACNEAYADFLANSVLYEIQQRIPSLKRSGHLLGGLSLSGLAAAYTLTQHPNLFSAALCQSGSFWWNEEWLTGQIEGLLDKILYISVGNGETQSGLSHQPSGMRQEVTQLDACRRFAERMKQLGNRVRFNIFEGSHEMSPWAGELPDALQWLITENSRLS